MSGLAMDELDTSDYRYHNTRHAVVRAHPEQLCVTSITVRLPIFYIGIWDALYRALFKECILYILSDDRNGR